MNSNTFKPWRLSLELLVDAVLFVLDLVVECFIGIVLGLQIVWKCILDWLREDPKTIPALKYVPPVLYVFFGLVRFLGYLYKGPTIAIWPIVDWWWVGIIKCLHWLVS